MSNYTFTPGCFGSSLIFKQGDAACKQCYSGEACAVKSLANKQAIRAKTCGSVAKKSPFEIKVEKTVTALRKLGLNITQKLKSGVNPFTEENATLYVFCHILIEINKLGRKFTEGWVEKVMTNKIGAKRSQGVKILCAAFLELGVLANDGGFLRVDM